MTATPDTATARASFADTLAVYLKPRVLIVLFLGFSAGLPLALQLIGRAFDEETVLRVATELEEAAQFRHLPSFVAGGGND